MSTPTAPSANTPLVRTRQGCLTCRKRRRKCDEGKPICKGCADRKLPCRYGVRLTFLEANLMTLQREDVEALSSSRSARYHEVKFVDGEDDEDLDSGDGIIQSGDTPMDSENRDGNPVKYQESATHSLDTAIHSHPIDKLASSEAQDFSPDHGQDHEKPKSNETGPSAPRTTMTVQEMTYESRNFQSPSISSIMDDQHGSYAESSRHTPSIQHSEHGQSQSRNLNAMSPLTPFDVTWGSPSQFKPPLLHTPSQMGASSPTSQRSDPRSTIMSDEGKHDLFKFYIDEVAPWLDMCTPQQSFTAQLPILATRFPPLRHSLMAIAACQKEKDHHSDPTGIALQLLRATAEELGQEFNSFREEAVSSRALLKVAELWDFPPKEWMSIMKDVLEFWQAAGAGGFLNDKHGEISLLLIRFALAGSVFARSELNMNLDDRYVSEYHSNSQHSASDCIRQVLILCVQAFNLSTCAQSNSQSTVAIWSRISSELQTWHSSLPSEMRPIFKSGIGRINNTPGTSGAFPLSIHTSQTSLYGSILYHFTNICLLQCVPRRMKQYAAQNLGTVTWHAVQLCGLSVSNEIRWSWDPVTIVTLFQAGMLLSFEDQQVELFHHLSQLTRITGWKFERELQNLSQFWAAATR